LDEITVSGRNGETYYRSSTNFSPEEIVKAIEVGRSDIKNSRIELFNRLSDAVKFNADYSNPEFKRYDN
jgi:hypothetical protein